MRLLLAIIGYTASCLLLLYIAGSLGAAGVVLVALAELAVIGAIWKASEHA